MVDFIAIPATGRAALVRLWTGRHEEKPEYSLQWKVSWINNFREEWGMSLEGTSSFNTFRKEFHQGLSEESSAG